jgi:hypothetical protein
MLKRVVIVIYDRNMPTMAAGATLSASGGGLMLVHTNVALASASALAPALAPASAERSTKG